MKKKRERDADGNLLEVDSINEWVLYNLDVLKVDVLNDPEFAGMEHHPIFEQAYEARNAALQAQVKARATQRRKLIRRLNVARRAAKSAGLHYWPALLSEPTELQAYLDVESVLRTLTGQTWSPLSSRGIRVSTGWDWRGHRGLSPRDAVQLRRIAGVHLYRLYPLVKLALAGLAPARWKALKGINESTLKKMLTGFRWLLHNFGKDTANLFDFNALRAMGTLSAPLRWAAVHELPIRRGRQHGTRVNKSPKVFHLRHLNWEAVQQAQKSPVKRLEFQPLRSQWGKLMGFEKPKDLQVLSFKGLKVSLVRKLYEEFGLQNQVQGLAGVTLPILNLVRLFGDHQAIRRFVALRGLEWSIKGVHDAGQFTLPGAPFTASKWASLCLRHPDAVAFAHEFGRLEERQLFPQSLSALKVEISRLSYPYVPHEFADLARFCATHSFTPSDFQTYLEFWQGKPAKTAVFMPYLSLSGTEVGLDATWKFETLAPTDYRGPLLGRLTGCCQHLTGAGAASAIHGVSSPYSGFYAVSHAGKTIAQAWCWLNTKGDLVIDSVETIDREESRLLPVLKLFAQAMLHMTTSASLSVNAVYLADTHSGMTPALRRYLGNEQGLEAGPAVATVPMDYCDYYDGATHHLYVGKPRGARSKSLPKTDGYSIVRAPKSAKRPAEYQFLNMELGHPAPYWDMDALGTMYQALRELPDGPQREFLTEALLEGHPVEPWMLERLVASALAEI